MLPITSHASLFSRAKTEGDPSNYKRRREKGRETKRKSETEIEIIREIKQGFVSLLSQNPSLDPPPLPRFPGWIWRFPVGSHSWIDRLEFRRE
ncbi:hypothetical protein B296_00022078 [Ensete ventricosum]|uniref:Uncharacterized protein n=1 Tax=Ensete ventricosum TaxID=4639 RepID=A0A427AYS9_ENSVE|nr:hypothetical protein B296_00022078 [Ensete ventricosum]